MRCEYEKFSPLASTAASQHGVLTYEQLRANGLSQNQIDYQVRQGAIDRRARRIYTVGGSAATWHRQVCVAALAAAQHTRIENGPVGAASHRSALRLFGLRSVDDDVDVSVRYPRRLSVDGARVVRSVDLEPGEITWVEGIPVTTPERSICDSGLIFPEHEVMRMLRHGIATGLLNRWDTTRLRIRIGRQGRNGAGVIGRCLEALAPETEQVESALEAMFLEICERFDLPEPVVQLPVIANGRRYRLDFAYPSGRVFVEIDGSHHAAPMQISKDGGRQNDLVGCGWTPIRFDYDSLRREPERCANVLRQTLRASPYFCEPPA